jgi:hypothetical protein
MKTRSTLLGWLLAFGVLLLGGLAAGTAYAQCCTTPTPPCCTTPTPPCCTPPPVTPPSVCCDNNNRTNVHVNVSTVNVAVAASRAGAGAGAAAGAAVYYGGGGGGGGYAAPMASGMIQGLAVDSGKRMKRVAYEASRTKITRVVIQAVCIDDRTIPHPASQVSPDRNIEDAYEGEIYRCIAGTWLQATIADYDGRVDFSGGRTLTCHKNDALWHGRGGKVECRPQAPARDCNERSLLRRFGAGIKILTMIVTERYTAYREEEEKSEAFVATSMSLDGGVGGIVY